MFSGQPSGLARTEGERGMSTTLTEAEAFQTAAEYLSAGRWIFDQLARTQDPVAVARMAKPDGSEQEIQRLAQVCREWLDKQEAKRERGAA
jgi:hypothetical protein